MIIDRWRPISRVEHFIQEKKVTHLILGDFLVVGFFKGSFDHWLDSYFVSSLNPHKPEDMYRFAQGQGVENIAGLVPTEG